MLENTKKALEVFQNAIECVQCKNPKENLQYLGTSCKHAYCWDCISEFNKKVPGKRTVKRAVCSKCAFPLDMNNIVGASVLNTCFDTLTELKVLLEQARPTQFTQADLACTQRIFDEFHHESPENPTKKANAVEKFLETQCHMPDEVGQKWEEEEEVIGDKNDNRENSISPELDVFYDYTKGNTPTRSSVKRPLTTENHPQEPKLKKQSILKNSTSKTNEQPVEINLFASQVPQRSYDNDQLTPFINRRSTAPTTSTGGLIGKYAEPFRSNSTRASSVVRDKKDAKNEPVEEENPFTKKIVLHKRQASIDQMAKKEPKLEKQQDSDPDYLPPGAPSTSSRRNSVKFEVEPRRSQSPMSFGERSMAAKGEQRRSSYGTRRGEVVLVNSILNNRIPQLKKAVEVGTCVNEKDKNGKTALYVAVEQNNMEAVEILVDAAAVINASCGPTFETTLHEAIRRKNLEIIEYLLSKGASMKIRNGAGKTAEELGMKDAKIKKILEKFKNEHVLQPVIPPPKSKIHFVQLIDDKMITEAEKKKLPGKINLVTADMDAPTHVVVNIDLKSKILNINKDHLGETLKAIVKSGMIVSREWLKACIIDPSRVDDDRHFAVRKVQWLDGPIFENKIGEWKKQIVKMQPKLFAGCKFYFPCPKYNFLDRAALIEIVRGAGGQASAREPIINEKDPPPYHNANLKPNFIVYGLQGNLMQKFQDCTKYNLVSEQYVIESILTFSLPPQF